MNYHHFICLNMSYFNFIFEGSFAAYRILGWQDPLPSSPPLLSSGFFYFCCEVSCQSCCFLNVSLSLIACKIYFLVFSNITLRGVGVVFFVSVLLGICRASGICGKFSAINSASAVCFIISLCL